VSIEIGGGALTDGETGAGELARILQVAGHKTIEGWVQLPGDHILLRDLNGDTVGYVRMVGDWAVGEEVWVTTRNGALVKAEITRVAPTTLEGFDVVTTRASHTLEPMADVMVDHAGLGITGQPHLGRVR
jgi:hypothetical protein